jgi:hypothetical protein
MGTSEKVIPLFSRTGAVAAGGVRFPEYLYVPFVGLIQGYPQK